MASGTRKQHLWHSKGKTTVTASRPAYILDPRFNEEKIS